MKHPALIDYTIVDDGDDYVTVTETWDHTHPKCPVIVFDMTVWPFEKRADALTVIHKRRIPRAIAFP